MDSNKVKDINREGVSHLEFRCELYRLQSEEGRLFLYEHPLSAWSWRWPCMAEVLRLPGVRRVRGDMCAHNMIITDSIGPAKVFKPTGWLSNSTLTLNELNKLCSNNGSHNDHRHANLEDGRARHAQVYPEELCLDILWGLRAELEAMGVMRLNGVETVCEDLGDAITNQQTLCDSIEKHFF